MLQNQNPKVGALTGKRPFSYTNAIPENNLLFCNKIRGSHLSCRQAMTFGINDSKP